MTTDNSSLDTSETDDLLGSALFLLSNATVSDLRAAASNWTQELLGQVLEATKPGCDAEGMRQNTVTRPTPPRLPA